MLSVRLSRVNGVLLAVYIELFTLLVLFTWAHRHGVAGHRPGGGHCLPHA